MTSALTSKDLSFQHTDTFSIKQLSVKFEKGKVISIIGPNGSGKSTLLHLLTTLLPHKEGYIYIDGKEIHHMKQKQIARMLTMLPQTQDHQLDLTVRDLVKHGRFPHRKWHERLNNEDVKKVDWAISVTNMTHLQHRLLQTLSGGERQRAWIAMALSQSTKVLLLDEPTTYLDISHQLEVMELVQFLNKKYQMTIIMVLHDINQAGKV